MKLTADEKKMRPDVFGTLLLPVTDLNDVRDHQFYLSLWTRTVEATLFGKSALRIKNNDDRCVWLFVRETTTENHYHAACRLPLRKMLEEHQTGRVLTTEGKCQRLQAALVQASTKTPEPYQNPLSTLRGADIQVKPWVPEHAQYIFKENTDVFILPHLPRKKYPTA